MNNTFKILVVDDSPEMLDIASRALRKANFNVFSASDGAECIEILHREKPDILLLDVMLPDANGIELAKTIKNNPEFSPVFIILLSALKTSAQDVSEGLEEGADGYIVRPVSSRELLARVSSACRIISAEREIINKNTELQKLNAEKDKFFSIIAHDLKSPFSGFLGLTQIMAEELPNLTLAEAQDIAVSMKNSAIKLYSLLENLLEWSLIQKGSVSFNPNRITLFPVVSESVGMVNESAKTKNIEIAIDVAPKLEVFADTKMLQTIVRNLVSNAVKFTSKGGKVGVSAKVNSEKSVEILVQDSGIGMSREMVKNLFRIDVKTGREGTEGEPSTGLGLMLCKEFVEKNGGRIWVESEEGKGSLFSFSLPRDEKVKLPE